MEVILQQGKTETFQLAHKDIDDELVKKLDIEKEDAKIKKT